MRIFLSSLALPTQKRRSAERYCMTNVSQPKISVIVLSYNGHNWLPRCFESLQAQTLFGEIEIIVTDNKSSDGSDALAAEWLEQTKKGRILQNGANLGYCEANNKAA